MKKITKLILSSAFFFSCLTSAHDYNSGQLHIDHPWSKQVPPSSSVAAAFFEISNKGNENDTLIRAESPIAGKTELHAHIHEDGMMKMREVEEIVVPANGSKNLKPGSYHIMFFDLQNTPKLGERFPLTLHFAKAGRIEVEVTVEPATYQPKGPENNDNKHHSHH
ncbi:copper chaperone PCu(A)C [uncultured Photobacterium sp.]|uniref:copper chaperone PCu(A)C n=1 Tax=uncultured Photobacterium sp. TaxID=173973 RepID=UPI00262EEC29|nr:copper chaperone PCu(A)C [uncultured Photobacterium sp.]